MSESFDKNEMANTNEVRTHWGLAVNLRRREKRLAEFDRWLEQVIRQAKAEAWGEGYRVSDVAWVHAYSGHPVLEGEMCPGCRPSNPYTEEADHE